MTVDHDALAALFRPASPAFQANPYPVYRRLQREAPVLYRPHADDWVVTGYEAVEALLKHPLMRPQAAREPSPPACPFSTGQQVAPLRGSSGTLMPDLAGAEAHARLKAAVQALLAPREVAPLRGRLEAQAEALVAALKPKDTFDVVHDVALPFTLGALSSLLGIPDEDHAAIHGWVLPLLASQDAAPPDPRRTRMKAHMAQLALDAYCRRLLDARRHGERDDYTQRLLAGEAEGTLTALEVRGLLATLLLSGYESSRHAVALAVYTLLRHPRQLALLRATPALLGTAVEEVLRYASPVQSRSLTARGPIAVGAHTLRAGQRVHLILAAANRDPACFDDPDRFDLRRRPNRHLTFGVGSYHCPGFALARLEMEVALHTLLAQLPDLELAEAPALHAAYHVRGFEQLIVRSGAGKGQGGAGRHAAVEKCAR